jgi:hypothetical protein
LAEKSSIDDAAAADVAVVAARKLELLEVALVDIAAEDLHSTFVYFAVIAK